ncbi:hypothetical protein ACIBG7_31280 [Nonomuraea sp. NPDC050328]|uniref:hypothetical protein n=1 Tax=Nonomuraea sp. NPDC050328 TaxID=3364361 RepID=UPI0037A3EC19
MRALTALLATGLALAGCAAPETKGRAAALPPAAVEPEAVPWEGGPAYYARFPQAAKAGWTDPRFFPVGLWFAAVRSRDDVEQDRGAGITTYFELTADSDIRLVRGAGLSALTSRPFPGHGSETVGWLLAGEADMWGGPGKGRWTGVTGFDGAACTPKKSLCGYTALATLKSRLPRGDGRMFYATYGKGVMYWQANELAAAFVNDYTDAVSTSLYWYTDPAACDEGERFMHLLASQCRLAANYGGVIDRQRLLDARDGRLQPIYAFVELGRPRPGDSKAITPAQVAGAVMSSLIHGARGVIYLAHSAEPACRTTNLLRERCGAAMRKAVTDLNGRLARLAPVLNSQSLTYGYSAGLDTMLKRHEGFYYLFAMPKRGGNMGAHSMTVPVGLSQAGEVEVLFEGRRLPVDAEGRFTDTFAAEHSYHIYRIPLGEARP